MAVWQKPTDYADLPSSEFGRGVRAFGTTLAGGAAILQSIGAFYAVQAQQSDLKSQALSAEHEAVMADLGARQAEIQARMIRRASIREKGRLGLRAAQEQATDRVSAAARGLQAGVGSARDVQVSLRIAEEIDKRTLTASALQQEHAAQRQALSLRHQGQFARVSARNARRSAKSLSPAVAAAGGALQGLGGVLRTV